MDPHQKAVVNKLGSLQCGALAQQHTEVKDLGWKLEATPNLQKVVDVLGEAAHTYGLGILIKNKSTAMQTREEMRTRASPRH